jgi:hypothetical protein
MGGDGDRGGPWNVGEFVLFDMAGGPGVFS